ncbi:hypothetical protein FDF74_12660 [Clostridium niameyense]|uniref:DUF2634 domain-containing protein n=1 Tax=Clostridium niameyense TaxID=1622073 RepID=A0A6M0RCZ2_9CLOT|nr:hypothetical protein [Clostridium niameyense]NEZ48022.1 hypothetical protein [Clostridium niameyense]
MKSIAFDNGDLVISSKRLKLVNDLEQKMQKTKGLLLVVLGELFYNTDIGLNYEELLDIKEKNISIERKKLAIIEAIFKDENVEKVDVVNFYTDRENRKQTIEVKLKYKDYEDIVTIGGVSIE